MNEAQIETLGRFKWAFYLIALLMVVSPPVDLALNVFPWRPGDIQWRYGAVGLVSGFLMTTVLGVGMVAGLAAWFGHGWIQRLSGLVWLVAGIALVLACGGFLLDMIQLRADVAQDQRWAFDIAGLKAVAKNLAGAGALIWVGVIALRSTRPRPSRRRRHDEGTLVASPPDE